MHADGRAAYRGLAVDGQGTEALFKEISESSCVLDESEEFIKCTEGVGVATDVCGLTWK